MVVADNGQLLVFSGLDAAKRSLSRVVHIDPATGRITEAPKLPRVLHDAAGTTLGSVALLIGGGEQESGYDHVTAVTGPQADQDVGHLPQARSDLAATTVGDTVYVIGGYDGKNLPTSIVATTDGATFRSVANLEPAVRYPAVGTAHGDIYIFGGKTVSGQTDAIQRYDPNTRALSTVGHLPTPMGHAEAFALGDTIYLAGGRIGTGASDTANNVSAQVWSFDPTNNAVSPAGTLPSAIADAGVAVIDDHAYIVGGETDGADTPTNSVMIIHR